MPRQTARMYWQKSNEIDGVGTRFLFALYALSPAKTLGAFLETVQQVLNRKCFLLAGHGITNVVYSFIWRLRSCFLYFWETIVIALEHLVLVKCSYTDSAVR